jgi:hypothetical protein
MKLLPPRDPRGHFVLRGSVEERATVRIEELTEDGSRVLARAEVPAERVPGRILKPVWTFEHVPASRLAEGERRTYRLEATDAAGNRGPAILVRFEGPVLLGVVKSVTTDPARVHVTCTDDRRTLVEALAARLARLQDEAGLAAARRRQDGEAGLLCDAEGHLLVPLAVFDERRPRQVSAAPTDGTLPEGSFESGTPIWYLAPPSAQRGD